MPLSLRSFGRRGVFHTLLDNSGNHLAENGFGLGGKPNDLEAILVVQSVGNAPQCAADDLLAKKMRAECTNAENMRDRIRVPALGEHRYRYDASYGLAQLAGLQVLEIVIGDDGDGGDHGGHDQGES